MKTNTANRARAQREALAKIAALQGDGTRTGDAYGFSEAKRLATDALLGAAKGEQAARTRELHTVKKAFHFEAAHRLPHHGGKCARVHGHSYRMTITLRGERLAESGPQAGMLQDHWDVSKVVQPILDKYLDHYYLNDSTGLENPTVELLCRWLWEKLVPELVLLHAIHIKETCTASYTYRRSP